jgi:MFS family permease
VEVAKTSSRFGILADRYGRRPLFFLTVLGAILQDAISKIVLWRPDIFPPQFIWLSSLATFVGGGDAVATSLIFLIIADVALPSQRAKLFFVLTACERVGEIIALPLSALLMSVWNPWIPYLLYSILTLIGGMVPILFLPETLAKAKQLPPQTGPSGDAPPCESDTDTDEEFRALPSPPKKLRSSISAAISRFRPLVKRNVVAVLLAFFVSSLGRQSMRFLLQYIRQRFGWTYEKVCAHPPHGPLKKPQEIKSQLC